MAILKKYEEHLSDGDIRGEFHGRYTEEAERLLPVIAAEILVAVEKKYRRRRHGLWFLE